jgi:hypothetical protein
LQDIKDGVLVKPYIQKARSALDEHPIAAKLNGGTCGNIVAADTLDVDKQANRADLIQSKLEMR